MQTYLPSRLFSFRHFFFRDEGRGGGRGWQTVFCPPVLIVCFTFDLGRVVRRPISLTRVLFSIVQKVFSEIIFCILFSPFRALFPSSTDVPVLLLNQPIILVT